jgi:hypothetical protein
MDMRERTLDRGVRKEEKIIYPHADRVLTASDRARLNAFIDGGAFPDEWVCERVGPLTGCRLSATVAAQSHRERP